MASDLIDPDPDFDPRDPHQRYGDSLRHRILSGEWPPGTRIPNRVDLRDEYQTSLATIQKSLDLLKRDGFVRPRGRAGTYVRKRLPHCYRIALASGQARQAGREISRMYRAVDVEAERINAEGRWHLVRYHGLADPHGAGARRLAEDLTHDCLAGVFLVGLDLVSLKEAGVLDHLNVPAMALATSAGQLGIPQIKLPDYLDKAVKYLISQKRKRVGFVNSVLRYHSPDLCAAALEAGGLETDPYRFVSAYPSETNALRVAVYHMMRQPKARRPDALVVTDDHMVEPVTKAVQDAGVEAPRDVLILAHCNYPLPPPHAVPVTCIGFDLGEMLERVVRQLAPHPETGERPQGRLPDIAMEPRLGHELPADRQIRQQITPLDPPPIQLKPLPADVLVGVAADDSSSESGSD